MNVLSINGTPVADIYVDAALSFNKPEKNVETFEIPGRNGDLVVDYGTFRNVVISYPVLLKNTFADDFGTLVSKLAVLKGYQKIECSNDPNYYRLGRFLVPTAPTAKRLNKDGYFSLSFDCKPQRFLKSGLDPWGGFTYEALADENSVELMTENSVVIEGGTTAQSSLTNPAEFEARPLIKATGSGMIVIGTQVITITDIGVDKDIYIDSESMECYTLTAGTPVNAGGNVSFSMLDFPVLNAGSNAVTHTMPIEIIPRWWRL
jgi:phage-related protein